MKKPISTNTVALLSVAVFVVVAIPVIFFFYPSRESTASVIPNPSTRFIEVNFIPKPCYANFNTGDSFDGALSSDTATVLSIITTRYSIITHYAKIVPKCLLTKETYPVQLFPTQCRYFPKSDSILSSIFQNASSFAYMFKFTDDAIYKDVINVLDNARQHRFQRYAIVPLIEQEIELLEKMKIK